ncbi:MAG: hypothetical protein IIB77_01465 [Proteobacteria bacterium]|nr:hypothetical protein [Pseudomonadota bacterium]
MFPIPLSPVGCQLCGAGLIVPDFVIFQTPASKRAENDVPNKNSIKELLLEPGKRPRAALAQLPSPIHRLDKFRKQLNGLEFECTRILGGTFSAVFGDFALCDEVGYSSDCFFLSDDIRNSDFQSPHKSKHPLLHLF